MTVPAGRRGNRNQQAVIRGIDGGMGGIPAAAVTGRAITSNAEVLTDRQTSQATISIVTAGAAIMGIDGSTG